MYENAIIITAKKETVEAILDRIVKDDVIDFASILPETWQYDNETSEEFAARIDALKKTISYNPSNKTDKAYTASAKVIECIDDSKAVTRVVRFDSDFPAHDFVQLLSVRYPDCTFEYKYINKEKHCCASETYINGRWDIDDIVLNDDTLDEGKTKVLAMQYAKLHYESFDKVPDELLSKCITEVTAE